MSRKNAPGGPLHGLTLPILMWLGCWGCASGDPVDGRFDTRVSRPAWAAGQGPRVLFDEAHHNAHHAGGSYSPFVRLIESDGCRVETGASPFTAGSLHPYAVVVIAAAMGGNDANDDPALAEPEIDALDRWVSSGGALLLVTDHYPFGHAAESLAHRFGVEFDKGIVEDPARHDPAYDDSHIVFSRDNGGLGDHPILRGRDASERVAKVLTFTGQGVRTGSPDGMLLILSDTAVARAPRAAVERRGSDVLVNVTYGDPVPAGGWGQGVAMQHGRGRVVVLGEAAMLSARLRRNDGRPIGMNVEGYDNRQLALNIVRWLAGLV